MMDVRECRADWTCRTYQCSVTLTSSSAMVKVLMEVVGTRRDKSRQFKFSGIEDGRDWQRKKTRRGEHTSL